MSVSPALFRKPWMAASGAPTRGPFFSSRRSGWRGRQAGDVQRQPARRREGLRALVEAAPLDQRVGDELAAGPPPRARCMRAGISSQKSSRSRSGMGRSAGVRSRDGVRPGFYGSPARLSSEDGRRCRSLPSPALREKVARSRPDEGGGAASATSGTPLIAPPSLRSSGHFSPHVGRRVRRRQRAITASCGCRRRGEPSRSACRCRRRPCGRGRRSIPAE